MDLFKVHRAVPLEILSKNARLVADSGDSLTRIRRHTDFADSDFAAPHAQPRIVSSRCVDATTLTKFGDAQGWLAMREKLSAFFSYLLLEINSPPTNPNNLIVFKFHIKAQRKRDKQQARARERNLYLLVA